MKDGARIKNIVCVVLCVVLAGALVLLICAENQKEQARSAANQALQEEAAPYEIELRALKKELSDLESEVSYFSEEAKILVGFVASDASDLEYVAEKASAYGFSPVLVIDCTMEMDVVEDIVEAADESWEIMLYVPAFSEDTNEDVLAVMSYLEDEGVDHTGVFLLRSDYATESNIQMLKDDGFVGYTNYSDSPASGQTEDGTVYFDYSYLRISGTNVTSRISAMYNNKASMMVAFDMGSIQEGSLTEAYVTELFDTLQSYAEEEDCSFSTTADVVEELSEVNSIEAGNRVEYEKQAAEIQAQIDELEDTIDEIYDRLEY